MASQAATASGTLNVANTRIATIKWNDINTQAIIGWLSEKDGEGLQYNLDKLNKRNKQHTVERMLRATGLISKSGVDKKKASDKIKGTVYIALSPRKFLIIII